MHQIRSITLYSYLEVANSLGVDGLPLLSDAGISASDLSRPEMRLPAKAVTRLLERTAAMSGCDSFGIRMAQRRSFASLGALSLLLERLNSVADVLKESSALRGTLSNVLIISTEVKGGSVCASFEVAAPYNNPQAADLTVGLAYVALTGATRGRWEPEAVHFSHRAPLDQLTFQRFFRAPLVFESDFSGFSFGQKSMSIACPLADSAMAENARRLLNALELTAIEAPVSDHARDSILQLLRTGRATISEVAHNLSTTERALQRQLRAEGKTFADLLNGIRRDLARRYLLQSSQSLTSISERLGYANQSSFSRWFEREFGTAPSVWRKAQRTDFA